MRWLRPWLLVGGHLQVDFVYPTVKLPGSEVARRWLLAVEIPETFVDHLESVGGDADLLRVLRQKAQNAITILAGFPQDGSQL